MENGLQVKLVGSVLVAVQVFSLGWLIVARKCVFSQHEAEKLRSAWLI